MAKVNPAQLKAEAQELMDQLTKAKAESEASDTEQELEEVIQEAPEEPEESAEVEASQVSSEESEGGDDPNELSALDERIEKAERAMKGAQRKMTQATQEASELRNQNEALLQAVSELKGQIAEQARDNERLQQLREEYPDVATPLLDEIQRLQARVDEHADLNSKRDQDAVRAQQEREMEQHFERIRAVHPDFQDVTNTSDWALWIEDQDPATQQWVQNGTSNDVNAVISRFKSDMGMKTPTPQEKTLERAKEAASPKMPKARKSNMSGGKKSWSVDEIKRMPNELFEKHKREILESYKEGNIRR